MYTRSFYPEGEDALKQLPENYGGVTFNRPEAEDGGEAVEAGAPAGAPPGEKKSIFSSLGRLPFLSRLDGLPFLSTLGLNRLGTEELILIGAALYLFFSKDGDRECAVILLLLLLVH